MSTTIPVYFGAVKVVSELQAYDPIDLLKDIESFDVRGLVPHEGWYSTLSRNYWLQHVLNCIARHQEIAGLEFNFPALPGTSRLVSGCSVLDSLKTSIALRAIEDVAAQLTGGIPPLGDLGAEHAYIGNIRKGHFPGAFESAPVLRKIEPADDDWKDVFDIVAFYSYVKMLRQALLEAEGERKFVFVLATPWGANPTR